jgi:hypothetical protein
VEADAGACERGGSRSWNSAATRRRAARCRATVEGGGVGVTRNGAADKWAGTRWGPVISSWVRGEAARQAVSAVLTSVVGSTVRPIRFSNRIKFIQTDSNLPQTLTDPKGAFPCLKNWK